MGVFQKFGEYYDFIYLRLWDYKGECNLLEEIFNRFGREKPRRILDLGCGTGSHALILAKRGYEVTGVDISHVMIERARKKAKEAGIKADFLVQNMNAIELSKKFDCAISMGVAFGYLLTYADLVNLFSSLKRLLEDNGLFIFEFWTVGGLKPTPYKSWMKMQEKNATLYRMSESNFNPETSILDIDMHLIVFQNDNLIDKFEEKHQIRCYTLAEMKHYVDNNGLEFVSAYNWDAEHKLKLKDPEKDTFRILVVAGSKST